MRMLLGIAALTLVYFSCGSATSQSRAAALPKNALPASVVGHGLKVETAQEIAINKAINEVESVMAKHNMTSFKITEEYLRKNILVDEGHPGEDIKALPDRDPFKAWVVTFRSEPDWWQDIVRRDHVAKRQLAAEARQSFGSQIIIGLGLLLLAGVGYVRLDEYTRRRYTTWVRLGGLAVAGSLVAGWCMFLQAPG